MRHNQLDTPYSSSYPWSAWSTAWHAPATKHGCYGSMAAVPQIPWHTHHGT